MSYRLYESRQPHRFLPILYDLLSKRSLFTAQPLFVIQNRQLAEWLRYRIADGQGIASDFSYRLPEKALAHLITLFDSVADVESPPVLYARQAAFVLYEQLNRRLGGKPVDAYAPLRFFFEGAVSKSVLNRRVWHLARTAALLFGRYDMSGMERAGRWEDPGSAVCDYDPEERWQVDLWRSVYGVNEDENAARYRRPGKVLKDIIRKGIKPENVPFPSDIILFGSPFSGEIPLDFYRYLSRFANVRHFLVAPLSLKQALETDPPFAKRWLQPLVDTARWAKNNGIATEKNLNSEEQPLSLLAHVQSALSSGNFGKPVKREPTLFDAAPADDGSIELLNCRNRWREVEVLKDKIFGFIDEYPAVRPKDIAVIAPDINRYASYIEAIFPEGTGLPYSIVDLAVGSDSSFLKGFFDLLSLSRSRFSRGDIFGLIDNPCFAERFSIGAEEREQWSRICDELNIRWGFDEKDRNREQLGGGGINTWRQAMRRMLLGMVFDEGDHPLLPRPVEDENGRDALLRLKTILDALHLRIMREFRKEKTLAEWRALLSETCDWFLACRAEEGKRFRDEQDRELIKREIAALPHGILSAVADGNEEPVRYDIGLIIEILQESVGLISGSIGYYPVQGIGCASLKPFRTVPYKAAFLLGMDEEGFPGQDFHASFDLSEKYPSGFSFSRRETDRYSFLELVGSVEKKLTFLYTGRDPVSGDRLQPSIAVTELFAGIETGFAISLKEEEHPLYNFDRRYFDGSGALFSYNAEAMNTVQRRADAVGGIEMPEFLIAGKAENAVITLKQLSGFLIDPAKVFFEQNLNIRLDRHGGDADENSPDNAELERFGRYALLGRLAERPVLLKQNIDDRFRAFCEEARLRGEMGIGTVGEAYRERLCRIAEGFWSGLLRKTADVLDPERLPPPKQARFVPYSGRFSPQSPGDAIRMEPAAYPDINTGLTGDTGYFYEQDDGSILLFRSGSGMRNSLKYLPETLMLQRINRSRTTLFQLSENTTATMNWENNDTHLQELCRLYISNLKQPIPLYPDLAKSLLQEMKEIGTDRETLSERAAYHWRKQLDSYGYSDIKESPHCRAAFGESPDFSSEEFLRLAMLLFRLFIR